MFHAGHFADVAVYRAENWDGPDSYGLGGDSEFDRPLIAQFAGDEPEALVRAAAHVEGLVDAVDLNLGCPQVGGECVCLDHHRRVRGGLWRFTDAPTLYHTHTHTHTHGQRIAKRGHYGSFLLDEPALVERLLGSMVKGLSVPVTAKIRVLPTERATLELVKRIEATGVALLTVHGRTKEQNKIHVGGADWEIIRKVKETVRIPVIANGGIETYADYRACLAETGADAAMSSEGLLENPLLFSPDPDATLLLDGRWSGPGGRFASREEEAFALAQRQLRFADEYLALAAQYWPREGVAAVKGHLFKFLYQLLELPQNHDLRERLGAKGNRMEEYLALVAELRETRYASLAVALRTTGGLVVAPTSWYRRHRVGAANHRKTDALLERPIEERLLSLKEALRERRAAREMAAVEVEAAVG